MGDDLISRTGAALQRFLQLEGCALEGAGDLCLPRLEAFSFLSPGSDLTSAFLDFALDSLTLLAVGSETFFQQLEATLIVPA